MRSKHPAHYFLLIAFTWAFGPTALAQTGEGSCGNPFTAHFGPWDYRTATKANKQIVERVHYTIGIQTLSTPSTTMKHEMAKDVAYTLIVFPNHHRALLTMEQLSEKYKADPPPGTKLPVECYYDRAVRYQPNDTVARSLYAQFLGKRNRKQEAIAQLDIALTHAKDNPVSHYNIGLLFLDLGEHERALEQARRAIDLGNPQTGLKDRLQAAGRWTEETGK